MQKLIILFAATLALVSAAPGKPNEKPNDIKWDVSSPGVLDLKTKGVFYDDGASRLAGSAMYSKNFVDRTQKVVGDLQYQHHPSNLAAGLNVEDRGRAGTRVQAELSKTLLKDRFTNIQGGLNYGQTFNTPIGNSEPFFGGFVRGTF
ncbi:uncharacterized protein LOC135141049 [Zophobas morio]|uniref:uncharacterized protein LOC135141049 n=1 Tax=Zophobas morio TaxID=2755281 RepID=UPI003083532A